MANVPAGGVKKRLTLQTKRRYQISSPAQSNSSLKSESFENVARKQLLTLCVPKSSLVPPLPTSKLQIVKDDIAENTCSTSLPTPNFKLLTSHQLCPLDLRKCQPVAVSVSDEQDVFNTTGACQGASSTSIHGVGGTVSRDTQKKSKSTDLSSLHVSGTSRMVQKTVGVAAVSTGWVSHVIQAQRKPVKIKTSVSSNNSETRYSVTNNPQKTRITDDRLTKAGQGFTKAEKWSKVSLCFSDKRKKPEEKNLRKRTWTEAGSDDDEFDQLCNMVDLSFDANVFSDQGTGVTTPDNSQGGGQSVHHTTSTAIGSMRRTWTCPVCNEQFEGRSAEEPACEQHMIQCLAMDVV